MAPAQQHFPHRSDCHTGELFDALRRHFLLGLFPLLAVAFVLRHLNKVPQLMSLRRPILVLTQGPSAGTVGATMSYSATIVRITTRPLPKADRIQLADAGGYTCIIGIDHKDGELGIVFPEGGQLAHDFCMANNLYSKDPGTGKEMGGYLEYSRRIRALKLRGVESNALWMPLSAVYTWLGHKHPLFHEGEDIDEVNGRSLCGKYYTAATIKMMKSNNPKERKGGRMGKALERHYDTPQLRSARLPTDGRVFITVKKHGTSGRTGQVMVEHDQWWITKQLNRLPGINIKPRKESMLVSGTRNCIVDSSPAGQGEKAKGFRVMIHNLFKGLLDEGEELFYEIVGFEDTGKPIMGTHHIGKIGDSKVEKRLKKAVGGDVITYHYGCDRNGRLPGRAGFDSAPVRFRVHVYRITAQGAELPWEGVCARVAKLRIRMGPNDIDFLTTVPELAKYEQGSWSEAGLREACVRLANTETTHSMPLGEGVCVRIETDTPDGVVVHKSLKEKSWLFCCLEGIARDKPEFVDREEIS